MITAILNLGQDVEEDWPLFVKDNKGEDHAVIFITNISLALAPVEPAINTDQCNVMAGGVLTRGPAVVRVRPGGSR